jgi:hypothetical protein
MHQVLTLIFLYFSTIKPKCVSVYIRTCIYIYLYLYVGVLSSSYYGSTNFSAKFWPSQPIPNTFFYPGQGSSNLALSTSVYLFNIILLSYLWSCCWPLWLVCYILAFYIQLDRGIWCYCKATNSSVKSPHVRMAAMVILLLTEYEEI